VRTPSVLAFCALAACASSGAPGSETADASADASPDATAEVADPCAGPGEELGYVDEFSNSTYRVVTGKTGAFIVSRDDAGLYAYAATCTYASCRLTITLRGDGVASCPCHGDRYDFDGLVLNGPATEPLAHYALRVCQRRVFVDATQVVPHTVRTVP
jgi:Rieske Fe-S protein